MSADIGMGKSQRYQAAVDGHEAAFESLEGILRRFKAQGRPEPEYELTLSIQQDLGGSCGLALLYYNPPIFGGFFFWKGA